MSYLYDPFGRRIQKSSSSGTTNYLYDGHNLIEETDGTGAAEVRYSDGMGTDDSLAMIRSGATSFYQADGLGSITSISNAAAAPAQTYTFNAFGKLTAASGSVTNPIQYTGREFDSETGMLYLRARYYDSTLGRFLSEDPLGFDGDGTDFYVYVQNNPVLNDDPSGLAKCTLQLKAGATSIPLDCTPDKPGHAAVHIQVASGNNSDPQHECKNNPKCTQKEGIGPIPEWPWTWTDDYTSKQNGRVLIPNFDTNRTNIRSHSCTNAFGPSRGPKFCSEGCVTGSPDDIKKLNKLIDSEPGSTLQVTH